MVINYYIIHFLAYREKEAEGPGTEWLQLPFQLKLKGQLTDFFFLLCYYD